MGSDPEAGRSPGRGVCRRGRGGGKGAWGAGCLVCLGLRAWRSFLITRNLPAWLPSNQSLNYVVVMRLRGESAEPRASPRFPDSEGLWRGAAGLGGVGIPRGQPLPGTSQNPACFTPSPALPSASSRRPPLPAPGRWGHWAVPAGSLPALAGGGWAGGQHALCCPRGHRPTASRRAPLACAPSALPLLQPGCQGRGEHRVDPNTTHPPCVGASARWAGPSSRAQPEPLLPVWSAASLSRTFLLSTSQRPVDAVPRPPHPRIPTGGKGEF